MTTDPSQESFANGSLPLLRGAASIALLVAAAVSFGLMLYAGRHNPSRALMALMSIWVLSPFALLAWATLASKRWSPLTRSAIYGVTLVVTLASLAVYIADFEWPHRQAAFVYVLVPPASWLLIAAVVPLAALISSRRSHRSHNS